MTTLDEFSGNMYEEWFWTPMLPWKDMYVLLWRRVIKQLKYKENKQHPL